MIKSNHLYQITFDKEPSISLAWTLNIRQFKLTMKAPSQNYMDPLQLFKKQIEARCEKSFQEVRKKNQITKTLIHNLNEGVQRQSKRIEILGTNIRNIQSSVPVEGEGQIKREINAKLDEKDKYINEVIQQIMNRIQGFEETLRNIPKPQKNAEKMKQLEINLNVLDNQIQQAARKNGVEMHSRGDFDVDQQRQRLYEDINMLERLLDDEKNEFSITNRELQKNLQVYKAAIQQPLNSFDVNLTKQNQENEKVLKSKLSNFSNRIKGIQANLQRLGVEIRDKKSLIIESERKFEEGLNNLGYGINKVSADINNLERVRNEKIQEHGNFLDDFVDKMLVETDDLNRRIDTLKNGYQVQINRMKDQIAERSQEVSKLSRGLF